MKQAVARPRPLPTRSGAGISAGGKLGAYYDQLRQRLLATAERKSHRLGKPAVEALLLVPDVFVLLVRLAADRAVPAEARALIGGALAYFLLPFDLFPEGIVGGIGYLDDLVLATAVLSQALGGELEPYARKYWNGDQELRVVLHDISSAASSLLGRGLYRRLRQLLAQRGIKVDDPGGA